ncbi:Predicted PurR-regulated permease PerM [Halomicrobium zhouii]|uniref:Predicted PurR-regulated permease PerM n=1 Tax=Halomicrobium zhouii TaxID=767519 RepID=A0A1I6KPB8_9EURY|nr:AI-2E family transporter [Halomicrobium zhouii]SFR92770.1 Predicted PurR-regulated permease PerM [Halomicrobium zhouii]
MSVDRPSSNPVRVLLARKHLAWWILGVVFLGVVAYVGYAYLPWIVFGLFAYYVARPVSRRLEPRVGSTGLAALATILLIVVPFVVFFTAFLLVALGQFVDAVSGVPVQVILDQLPFRIPALPDTPEEVYETVIVLVQEPSVQSAVGAVTGTIGLVGSVLYNLFLSILLAFFLLVNDRRLADWFSTEIFDEESLATGYFCRVDAGLKSVYFGYTMTIFAIVILSTVIYTAFNAFAPGTLAIPSLVLFGVVTGVFTLVPLVGRSIVYLFIAVVLGIQAVSTDPALLWYPIAFLLVMTIAFDNVVRTYIRPYLSGRMFATALVMFAYLLGPALFGWYGIFLGPLLLVAIVAFMQYILPILAHPERERVTLASGPTLDEYVQRTTGDPGASPDSDSEDRSPG